MKIPGQIMKVLCQPSEENNFKQQSWHVVMQKEGPLHAKVRQHVDAVPSKSKFHYKVKSGPFVCCQRNQINYKLSKVMNY